MITKRINLIAVDMGYGHQRAAYPLLDLSGGEIITLNNYEGIPEWEKNYWIKNLKSYENISRFKKIPLLGRLVFAVMDSFQKIDSFYPARDLSRPTIQQRFFYRFIKKGLGKDLIPKLDNSLPFVTTFFVAAQAAEYHNYPGDIYCIVCDTDASRAWAPLKPKTSRIKYFLPSEKLRERFLMYGLSNKNLFVTGFPLPKENIGAKQEILKQDLANRIKVLDVDKKYYNQYQSLITEELPLATRSNKEAITLTFAVGGAGAQKEVGVLVLNKLAGKIKSGEINLNLVAGSRQEVKEYFEQAVNLLGLKDGVEIIFHPEKNGYFKLFNSCLRKTDILWTKPSELSFYAALGLPIIISDPVGSQENFNRETLLNCGAGIDSLDPKYVDEWLPDLISSGRLARAAMDGFLNLENLGTYHIEKMFCK